MLYMITLGLKYDIVFAIIDSILQMDLTHSELDLYISYLLQL